jgi:hypothetical protein
MPVNNTFLIQEVVSSAPNCHKLLRYLLLFTIFAVAIFLFVAATLKVNTRFYAGFEIGLSAKDPLTAHKSGGC